MKTVKMRVEPGVRVHVAPGQSVELRPAGGHAMLTLAFEGSGLFRKFAAEPSVIVAPGDLLVFPTGTALIFEGGAEGMDLISAEFGFDTHLDPQLVLGFRDVLRISRESDPGASMVISLLCRETSSGGPGSELAVEEMFRLLVLMMVRSGISRERESGCAGLLNALSDPSILRAIEAIHARPADSWTVESLAAIAGMSRAAFAQRFAHTVGLSPISYLTKWRVSLAAELLRSGTETTEAVAEQSGYSSAAAFSTAFRRETSQSPSEFRVKSKVPAVSRTRSAGRIRGSGLTRS